MPANSAHAEGPRPAPIASDGDPNVSNPPDTRSALLRAAEELFGEIGFHETSVSAIAARAGVAQGTFYLHFPGKAEVFVELVREINRRFRREEPRALARLVDRRAIEREGFRTFFGFISMIRGAYRILRDAELVDPKTGRWFYESIVKGYIGGLRRGMERGEIRALALEPLAYALLGIGHSIALWSLTAAPTHRISEGMQERVQDLIEHGVAIYRG
jgi:AcrR family transcriptional regulator